MPRARHLSNSCYLGLINWTVRRRAGRSGRQIGTTEGLHSEIGDPEVLIVDALVSIARRRHET